jgi:RNA polymerase sigma-70 factor (ECF subfamily)
MSVAEIGVEMGTSEATVRSWLSRGRAAMAEHLAERRDVADEVHVENKGQR